MLETPKKCRLIPQHLEGHLHMYFSIQESFLLTGLSNYSFLDTNSLRSITKNLYVKNRADKEDLLRGIIIGTGLASPLPVLEKEILIVWREHDQILVDGCKQLSAEQIVDVLDYYFSE
ncbi:hypothetical protein SUGI_0366810 [Cryptomeria japonica]|nr:hypothetical protein SUGI_0366810 [Cryptomeria japonica]